VVPAPVASNPLVAVPKVVAIQADGNAMDVEDLGGSLRVLGTGFRRGKEIYSEIVGKDWVARRPDVWLEGNDHMFTMFTISTVFGLSKAFR
jgi:hypothetical protein